MYTTVRDAGSISINLPSDVALVYQAIRECENFMRECGIRELTRISVVLRELLTNAIVHGNRNDRSRSVYFRMEHTGKGRLMIVVEDEGEGFDYASLDTALPDDPRHIRNRGYVLIYNMSSAVEFNDCGNRVTVYVDVAEASDGRDTTRGNDISRIQASGEPACEIRDRRPGVSAACGSV